MFFFQKQALKNLFHCAKYSTYEKQLSSFELNKLSKQELIDIIQNINKSVVDNPKSINGRKEFDFSKYSKRHVALKIAYFGWNYQGLALQENTNNTVEEKLFEALERIKLIKDRTSCNFTRSGRTDQGVSAVGQVVALHLRSNLQEGIGVIPGEIKLSSEEINYISKINKALPNDIRVLAWCPVPLDFNARFSATYREYKYFFIKENLDIEKMKSAAKKFIGTHNFRNFCKTDDRNNENFTRTILSFDINPSLLDSNFRENYQMYEACIRGKGFLWHQIRHMMFALFSVGKLEKEENYIDELLNTQQIFTKSDIADAIPLVLHDCGYDNLQWNYGDNQFLSKQLVKIWSASRFKTAIQYLALQKVNTK